MGGLFAAAAQLSSVALRSCTLVVEASSPGHAGAVDVCWHARKIEMATANIRWKMVHTLR